MRYRLLALDVDGTLVHDIDEVHFSPRLRKAVAEVVANNVYVTVATGRMFRSALKIATDLGFNAPLVCYNGALVQPMEGADPLFHLPVPTHLAKEIIAFTRERGLHLNAYVDDKLVTERHTPQAEFSSKVLKVPFELEPELDRLIERRPTTKLVIITADPAEAGPLAAELSGLFDGKLTITRSLPTYVEIVHPHVSKWRSIELLCDHLKVSIDQVIAVGDSYNDVEMLTSAGLGVAMGNAPADVKALADHVAPGVLEDGVAAVIERFLL